jgi:hypothetical protein
MISAAAVAVAFTASAPASWGQSAPPTTTTATRPPIEPVLPDSGEADGDTVVHSWALAPAAGDPAQGGTRPNLSYEAAPGTQIDDQLTLFNYSNVQLTFRLYATDAFNNDEGAFDLLPGDERPTGVGTWVTVAQANVTLPPRSQATMPITVKVPATARPGDHAGAVLASSRAEGTGPDGKVVTLDRRTGTRLYVRVAGPLAPELVVASIRTTYQPSLNPASGTAKVTYRIENRGNVRTGGTQRVSVSGPFGLATKRKAAADLPELLPGEDVTLRATFEGVPAAAVAITKVRLDPEPVGEGMDDLSATSRRSFTAAVPFSVLALALAVWLVLRARRSFLRHQRERVEVGAQVL